MSNEFLPKFMPQGQDSIGDSYDNTYSGKVASR